MRERLKIKFNSADLAVYLLIVALLALQLFFGEDSGAFRYDREALASGQIWRLITGHFVHLSWIHLAFNAAALVVLKMLFARFLPVLLGGVVMLLLSLGISLLFWVFNPTLGWYLGFSGVVTGLYIFSACISFTKQPVISGVVMLALIVKVAVEQLNGTLVVVGNAGIPTVVDAHLYGLILGFILALPMIYREMSARC